MVKRIIYLVGGVIIIGGVYLLGVTQGYYKEVNAQNFNLIFQEEFSKGTEETPDFGLYKTVVELMNDKYYGDVNYIDVLYGSVKGAVSALDDPYTLFTTPAENKAFFSSLGGVYEGIGIELDYINDRLIVIAPVIGSPADEAGLESGDEVLAIDNRSVEGLDIYTVGNLIKGPRGTDVVLVIKDIEGNVNDVMITRDLVTVESVRLTVQDSIGILRITKFGGDTEKLFNIDTNQVIKEGLEGLVLDLRNNPGGYLDVGVEVANEFLDGGMIVEERFKDGKVTPFSADGDGKLADIPLVVLVNQGSASAAEIVAGAIRDNDRALIIGQPTYGKGSVQEVEEFGDG